MKHLKKGKKFGRVRRQRKSLMKHLAHALILHEKIKTTEAKAKALRPLIEKLITKGGTGDLVSRRYLASRLSVESAKKIFKELGPKYKSRKGGYTRIVKIPPRKSDGAKMAIIEFV